MGTFAETAIAITVYLLPTKEKNVRFPFPFAANKRKFAVSVFRLQKTNGSCGFPLAPFSLCGIPEMSRHGHGDVETWRHDTWRHGNMEIETWKHGDIDMETWRMETWRHGQKTENESPGEFP
jgi:hypothetical protein